MNSNNHPRIHRWLPWCIWGLGALFYYYEYLLRISPNVMHQELISYFGLSAAGFGNLFAFYYYIYTPMQLPVGVLLDRYSPRLLITLNCLICALGAFLFSQAHSLEMALFSRVLMGFGSAFAFVGILKLATLWLPPERFAMIAGMTTSLGMLGAMFGENVLTHLVIKAGWRPTLSYLVVVGIILAVFLWLIIRDKHPSHTNRFTSTTFRALFIGIFLVLRRPQIWICAIVGGILYTSLSVFAELWAKPYLQDARGFSPQTAALLTSMVFLGWAIGGPLMGYLSDRLNSRRMPLVLGAVLAIFCFLFVMYTSSHSVFLFSLFLFLFGLFSSTQNIVFAITQDNCERMLSGSALALTNMFVMLMGMVLQPLVGEALDYSAKVTGSTATKMVYTTHDYRVALLVIPILYVISAIAAIFLKKPLNKVAVPN